MVVDSCQDCSAGNLLVSSAGLRSLSGGVNVDANPTLQVAWAFEPCAPLITGKQGASGAAVEQQRGWGYGAGGVMERVGLWSCMRPAGAWVLLEQGQGCPPTLQR
jgi:hypothetical protein